MKKIILSLALLVAGLGCVQAQSLSQAALNTLNNNTVRKGLTAKNVADFNKALNESTIKLTGTSVASGDIGIDMDGNSFDIFGVNTVNLTATGTGMAFRVGRPSGLSGILFQADGQGSQESDLTFEVKNTNKTGDISLISDQTIQMSAQYTTVRGVYDGLGNEVLFSAKMMHGSDTTDYAESGVYSDNVTAGYPTYYWAATSNNNTTGTSATISTGASGGGVSVFSSTTSGVTSIDLTTLEVSDSRSTSWGLWYNIPPTNSIGNTLVWKDYVLGTKQYSGKQAMAASVVGEAKLLIPNGSTPTTPVNGDIWQESNHLWMRLNGVTRQIDQQGTVTSVTSANGDATVATTTTTPVITIVSAPKLTTARTINGTSFDGTGNITITAAAGTLTGTTLNATVVTSSLTSLGTVTTGTWNATNIGLGKGGTGAALSDPNAHRMFIWDDTDNATVLAVIGTNLSYDAATNTLSATGSGGITNSAANTQLAISDGTNVVGDADLTFTGGNTLNVPNITSPGSLLLTGTNIQITNSTSFGTITSSTSTIAEFLRGTDATTNTASTSVVLERLTSGTPANGIGSRIETRVQGGAGAVQATFIDAIATDVTSGSEDFDLVISTRAAGSTPVERFRISSTGILATYSGVSNNLTNLDRVTDATTSRSLTEADRGRVIKFTSSSAISVTLPNGLTPGFYVTLVKAGSGNVTVTATTTLNIAGGGSAVLSQSNAPGFFWHDASNVWYGSGTFGSGSGLPGGSDTYVQFNDGGTLGGDAGMTYNKTTDALTVGSVSTGGVTTTGNVVVGATLQVNNIAAFSADILASGTIELKNAQKLMFDEANPGSNYFTIGAGAMTTNVAYIWPTAAPGANGYSLTSQTDGTLAWTNVSGGGSPGGSDTYVQFNGSGSFAGDADFTFNGSTITVTGGIISSTASGAFIGATVTAKTVVEVGGNVAGPGVINFKEDSDNGTNQVQLQAPGTLAGDYTLTLPPAAPSANGSSMVVNTDGTMGFTEIDDPQIKVMQALGGAGLAQTFGLPILFANTGVSLADGNTRYIAVYLPRAKTLTGVKFYQHTQGVYTGDNNNRVGLYTYDGAGNLTLVASSTNSATVWSAAASNTMVTVPFSSTYAAGAGLYFVGILYNNSAQTTAPALLGAGSMQNAAQGSLDFTNNGRLFSIAFSQTNLASTQALSATTNSNVPVWCLIY